jgi:hypothetical protein
MLGATDATTGPDVAPEGIVTMISVSLHRSTVSAAPFRVTTLLPCKLPNPEPETATGAPTEPVVGDRLVITGAGLAAEVTDTLSKVAVVRLELLPLLTTNPIYTFGVIVIVWLDSNCVQYRPFGERYEVKVLPDRTIFTQYGRPGIPELPCSLVELPLVVR